MKIGIDVSFLRKPGTGIGQVTGNFLHVLLQCVASGGPGKSWQFLAGLHEAEFVLYTEVPIDRSFPDRFTVRSFLPRWWKRDDVIRKLLWERQVACEAMKDSCDVFISLSQSATEFPPSARQHTQFGSFQHVMVVHDLIPKIFPEYVRKVSQKLHWKAIERGIRKADRLVAISTSTKDDLVQRLGIAEVKITLAHIGLSPRFDTVCPDEQVEKVLAKYGLSRGYIYHGGGLEVRKNTEGVLRAYDLLCKNFQSSISNLQENTDEKISKLIISGRIHAKGNSLATDIAGLVSELGLQGRVKLLGFVPDEDLPALYRGAGMFVFPSLYEGFGLPPIEAMSQETPVIVSRTSSLPEICGDAARFVDAQDTSGLASEMRLLLSDASMRTELAAKGSARAKQYTWEKFMKAVLQ